MLKRLAGVLTLALGLLMLAPVVAVANVKCEPGQIKGADGLCVGSAVIPGDPGTVGTPGVGGPQVCRHGDQVIPCTEGGGYWNAARPCYAQVADPGPNTTIPLTPFRTIDYPVGEIQALSIPDEDD